MRQQSPDVVLVKQAALGLGELKSLSKVNDLSHQSSLQTTRDFVSCAAVVLPRRGISQLNRGIIYTAQVGLWISLS